MANIGKYINLGIVYSFYGIFFFVPLALYPRTFELFEFNKLWITLAVSLAILFLWVSKMILSKKFIFCRTPFDIPLGLFLLSQIISTIWSIDPYVSFWGYYSRFNGGLISLVAYVFLYYAFVSNFPLGETDSQTPKDWLNKKFFAAGLLSFVVLLILGYWSLTVPFLQDFFVAVAAFAAFLFFAQAFHFSPLKKLFAFILTSGLIVALWGFPSHFGYDPTCILFRGNFNVSCWTDAFQPTVRLFSTLGQPNWLAAYFSILIPVSLGMGIHRFMKKEETEKSTFSLSYYVTGGKRIATLSILFSILLFIEVLWTSSQSGFLGLGVGLFVFLLGLFLLARHSTKQTKKNIKIIAATTVVISLLLCFVLGNPIQGRFPFLSLNGLIHSQSSQTVKSTTQAPPPADELGGSDSGKIRLVVWRGALDIFMQHPLFGSGVETFAYAYYGVKPKEHNLLSEWDYLYNKAHNEYLNYLATTGAFGLGTYMLFIGWFLFFAVKLLLKEKLHDEKALLNLALLSAFVSILVSNFFGFSVVIINIFFFIIPGLVLAVSGHFKKQDALEYSSTPMKVTGIALVGILILYLEFFLLRFWYADQQYSMGYNLNRAQQYVAANQYLENAVSLAPQEDLYKNELSLNLATLGLLLSQQNQSTESASVVNRAVDMANNVVKNHPNNVVFYKTRIQTFFELSQINPNYFNDALAAIQKAQALAPTDAKIAYNEGLLYGQKGDTEKAKQALMRAIDLKSNYRDPRYALAVYLTDEAKSEKDTVKKQQLQDQAKAQLAYIITYIDPHDTKSKELLDSIK